MTDGDQDKQIEEILARYRSEIEVIRRDFREEINRITAGIQKRKMSEIEKKLDIHK